MAICGGWMEAGVRPAARRGGWMEAVLTGEVLGRWGGRDRESRRQRRNGSVVRLAARRGGWMEAVPAGEERDRRSGDVDPRRRRRGFRRAGVAVGEGVGVGCETQAGQQCGGPLSFHRWKRAVFAAL
jgi:hypothetical protein